MKSAISLPFILACVAGAAPSTEPTPVLTNSLGMQFVWISPGTFMMGSPNEEKWRKSDEYQHKVTLTHGFYLGVFTVTQEQWKEVMGSNPSKFTGGKKLPVEQVSWLECREFNRKLHDRDKRPYRLPTEAEWEYACRAGTTTPFYCGQTISTDQANYNGHYVYDSGTTGVYRETTTPVGSFPPNPWGLYDMHGNVWEWCQDLLDEYPRKQENALDPIGMTGENRVVRGGSWIDNPMQCRSAYRGASKPTLRHSLVGFRVCFNKD